MSKAYLLVLCLLMTSLTGCVDGENLEKTTDTDTNKEIKEDEIIEPVGTDNLSSLEKRISELEDTIEEYENLEDQLSSLEEKIGSGSSGPVIYFREYEDTDYRWSRHEDRSCFQQFNCTNLYEEDNLVFCYQDNLSGSEEYTEEGCVLSIAKYDTDGWIQMISFETTAGDFEVRGLNDGPSLCYQDFYRIAPNNTVGCLSPYPGSVLPQTYLDLCELEPVNQTITVSVYDNDGNSAEAEYYLDYDAVCNAPFDR